MTSHFSHLTAFAALHLCAFGLPLGSGSQAQDASQTAISVARIDARDKAPEEIERRSINTSRQTIVLVARGFDQTILQQAYNGLLDLRDAGIPSSYVIAPENPVHPGKIEFQFYSAGRPFGGPILYVIGSTPIDRIRPEIGRRGNSASVELMRTLTAERVRVERERREQLVGRTKLKSLFGDERSVSDWLAYCAFLNDPAQISATRQRLRAKGSSDYDIELGISAIRRECSDIRQQISRLRSENNLAP